VRLGVDPERLKPTTRGRGARRHKVWQYKVGSKMAASALVEGGVAYVGTDANALHAIDAGTGILKWTWDAPDKIQTTPVVVNNAVVLGCNDNFVYAIEIKCVVRAPSPIRLQSSASAVPAPSVSIQRESGG
jgi:outer membrane protein assembly factor BamB